MKKILLIIIPLLASIAVFSGFAYFLQYGSSVGALQVTANPVSYVFIEGKRIGQTPLCKCTASEMLKTGEYTIKVVPIEQGYQAFEAKIPVSRGVLTVVDRTFSKNHNSEGSIITLSPIKDTKSAELMVLSIPDTTTVAVDSKSSGVSPHIVKNLTDSDHEVKITKAGYRDKIVRIHTALGYRVTVTAFLAPLLGNETPVPTINLSPSPTASPSAALVPQMVQILETPIGYLRVRQLATVGSLEVGQVKPGEAYELVSEVDGWFQIKLSEGKLGWITTQYATKVVTPQ